MNQLLLWMRKALSFWDTAYSKTRYATQIAFDRFQASLFLFTPRKITSQGYGAYRDLQIGKALKADLFSQPRLPEQYGVALDERVVEYPWLVSRLPENTGKLLDAGSVLNFDPILRLPKFQNKKVFISTLAPETQCHWWRGVSYVYEDLRSSCFRDDYFDWIVCLSTIEHVGMDTSMYSKESIAKSSADALPFLEELHRVLKPGGTLYLSFPFGKKASMGWLQVFDLSTVETFIEAFHPRMQLQSYFRHGPKGWKACAPESAGDATYFEPGSDQPNPHRTAAAEAVCLLELVK